MKRPMELGYSVLKDGQPVGVFTDVFDAMAYVDRARQLFQGTFSMRSLVPQTIVVETFK